MTVAPVACCESLQLAASDVGYLQTVFASRNVKTFVRCDQLAMYLGAVG
jgi:hypothetical protein